MLRGYSALGSRDTDITVNALPIAGLILFLLGVAHSVLGERYILVRLFRRDNLPRLFGGTSFTIATLRFAWHITTVLWWGFAVLLWHLHGGRADPAFILRVIGVTALAAGLLPLVISRGRHLSWIALFAVAAIALLAAAD